MVMEPTEQNSVVHRGRAALAVSNNVVPLASGSRDLAARQGTSGAVAGDHGEALGSIEGPFRGPEGHDPPTRVQVRRNDVAVAQDLLNGRVRKRIADSDDVCGA